MRSASICSTLLCGACDMMDYRFEMADGSMVPVSEMPLTEIQACLADDMEIRDTCSIQCTAHGIRERLLIELLIREKGWNVP